MLQVHFNMDKAYDDPFLKCQAAALRGQLNINARKSGMMNIDTCVLVSSSEQTIGEEILEECQPVIYKIGSCLLHTSTYQCWNSEDITQILMS